MSWIGTIGLIMMVMTIKINGVERNTSVVKLFGFVLVFIAIWWKP